MEVVSRSDWAEILLARMAGGDLYAMETLQRTRRLDIMLDLFRDIPLYPNEPHPRRKRERPDNTAEKR
jgi:hypothetical protein